MSRSLHAHDDLHCAGTTRHHGTVVEGVGDGDMLVFSLARRALGASVAIQRTIAETFDDPGSSIGVRTGMS